jgi:hypothetical protein
MLKEYIISLVRNASMYIIDSKTFKTIDLLMKTYNLFKNIQRSVT